MIPSANAAFIILTKKLAKKINKMFNNRSLKSTRKRSSPGIRLSKIGQIKRLNF